MNANLENAHFKKNKELLGLYFRAYPHEVRERDFLAFLEHHPSFMAMNDTRQRRTREELVRLRLSQLKSVRTTLVKNRVLTPTDQELKTLTKNRKRYVSFGRAVGNMHERNRQAAQRNAYSWKNQAD